MNQEHPYNEKLEKIIQNLYDEFNKLCDKFSVDLTLKIMPLDLVCYTFACEKGIKLFLPQLRRMSVTTAFCGAGPYTGEGYPMVFVFQDFIEMYVANNVDDVQLTQYYINILKHEIGHFLDVRSTKNALSKDKLLKLDERDLDMRKRLDEKGKDINYLLRNRLYHLVLKERRADYSVGLTWKDFIFPLKNFTPENSKLWKSRLKVAEDILMYYNQNPEAPYDPTLMPRMINDITKI